MRVGYHLHVPFSRSPDGTVLYPRHHALFIEELARQSGGVKFFAFESQTPDVRDLALDTSLVDVVSLGPRMQHPAAYISRKPLRRLRALWNDLDVFLVRGPGPLVPRILRARGGPPRLPLIMGDLRSWRPNRANAAWRNASIYAYRLAYLFDEKAVLKRGPVLVNNTWLRDRLVENGCRHVRETFTSTLTEDMAANLSHVADGRRIDHGGAIRLLNTGRIVEEKGIGDIVEALVELRRQGINAELELVGWAPDRDPTGDLALRRAEAAGLSGAVRLTGYRAPGPELVERYKQADVYLFGSPTEWGMPQSLIEAMAAGLPVVTTDFEGSRGLLVDREHALVVPPRDPGAMAAAIRLLLEDADLRCRISASARRWAVHRTNERSVADILRHLREVANQRRT